MAGACEVRRRVRDDPRTARRAAKAIRRGSGSPTGIAPSSPAPVLRCRDLRKRFGDRVAVDGVRVATGSAMLIRAIWSNPSQAGAVGLALGMLLGALSRCMVPPDVLPDTVRILSHLTPHAWALDGFRAIVIRGVGIVEAPQLAVLLGFAAVLLTLALTRFRQGLAA